jgi:hypothetical protein
MVENEIVFRQINEAVQQGFDEVKRIAREDGQHHNLDESDIPLQFYCECSDENCRQRISVRPSRYNAIHANRAKFVILPHHQADTIEHVIDREDGYWVVEKMSPLPETVTGLHTTPIDNR